MKRLSVLLFTADAAGRSAPNRNRDVRAAPIDPDRDPDEAAAVEELLSANPEILKLAKRCGVTRLHLIANAPLHITLLPELAALAAETDRRQK